jgi:transposase-like protein
MKDKHATAQTMLREGYPVVDVADAAGVSTRTVYRWLNKGVVARNGASGVSPSDRMSGSMGHDGTPPPDPDADGSGTPPETPSPEEVRAALAWTLGEADRLLDLEDEELGHEVEPRPLVELLAGCARGFRNLLEDLTDGR